MIGFFTYLRFISDFTSNLDVNGYSLLNPNTNFSLKFNYNKDNDFRLYIFRNNFLIIRIKKI